MKDLGLKGYFIVHIWDKKGELLEATGNTVNDFHAITISPSKVTHLHFWKNRMGIEYIVHEFLHALMFFANNNKLQIQNPDPTHYRDEEFFARSLGEVVKQFYKKLHKLGITDDFDFLDSKEYNDR